jgi:hypothetical protein
MQKTTWKSIVVMEQEKWNSIRPRLERMFPANRPLGNASPAIPRSFSEYVQHRADMAAAAAENGRRQVAQLEDARKYKGFSKKIEEAFGGTEFGSLSAHHAGEGNTTSPTPKIAPHSRGPVLAQRTIWCDSPDSLPWRKTALWPSLHEMMWEGDQRVATENGRYGRYTPLPREPEEDEVEGQIDVWKRVHWSTRELIKPYLMDEVWRVPTGEDIYAPVDEIEDTVVPQLLNQELLDAIDDLF